MDVRGLSEHGPNNRPQDSAFHGSDKNAADRALAPQVAEAEAAIVKSDWKTAETKLDAWLTSHPGDARALFDAGYTADAQNRLDDAAVFTSRATEADPNPLRPISLWDCSWRARERSTRHGLNWKQQQSWILVRRTRVKARAWRALAEIDRPGPDHTGDPSLASQELLEALKLSPETPSDTLLAANLAEAAGQNDAAEAAYRRLLAKDPGSDPGQLPVSRTC